MDVYVEVALEPALADEQLANHAFAIGHVQVGLYPHAAHQFPAAFLDALLDLAKQGGIFLLHPGKILHAGLRIGEVGILLHELQRGGEGVFYHFHGFRPGPQPRHVDVRIADRSNGELLHPVIDRLQSASASFQGACESLLVAAVEGGEIDGFDGIRELLPMLRLAGGEAAENVFRGKNFVAQHSGIGLPGVIDQQLRSLKAPALGVEGNLDGDRDLLAGDGFFGERERIEGAAIALRHQAAIEKDPAIVRKAHLQADARAAKIVSARGLGYGEGGTVPGGAGAPPGGQGYWRPGRIVQRRIFAVGHVAVRTPLG